MCASLLLASCGVQNVPTSGMQEQTNASSLKQAASQDQIKAAQKILEGLHNQSGLRPGGLDWTKAQTSDIGDSKAVFVPVKGYVNTVMAIGIEGEENGISRQISITTLSNKVEVRELNLTDGSSLYTYFDSDGNFLSETGTDRNGLVTLATCNELRGQINSARNDEASALESGYIAVSMGGLAALESGGLSALGGAAVGGYFSVKASKARGRAKSLKQTYTANCG